MSDSPAARQTSVDGARRQLAGLGYQLEFSLDGGRLRCDCGPSAHPADVVVETVVAVIEADGTHLGDLLGLDCLSCGVKGMWWMSRRDPAAMSIAGRLPRARDSSRQSL